MFAVTILKITGCLFYEGCLSLCSTAERICQKANVGIEPTCHKWHCCKHPKTLAVWLRLELRTRITPSDRLAICSNTIIGPHLKFGSPAWDRTTDQLINSQLLYRWATREYSFLLCVSLFSGTRHNACGYLSINHCVLKPMTVLIVLKLHQCQHCFCSFTQLKSWTCSCSHFIP